MEEITIPITIQSEKEEISKELILECCCEEHDITSCDEMGDLPEKVIPDWHGTVFVGREGNSQIWYRKRVCPRCVEHGDNV